MGGSFVKVAKASALSEGRSKRIRIGDEEVALWHVRGKFYAISNVCAHQHFSALHQGILQGLEVTCPMHGWTYSLETGRATSGSGSVKTYAVKVLADDIWVEAPEESGEE